MSPRARASRACAAAVLVAGAAGCAPVLPGIETAKPGTTDRVRVTARPQGWRRIAVVPFGGDPAHRRPAEELVALGIQRSSQLWVAAPFVIHTAVRRAAGGAPPLDPEAWTAAYLAGGSAGDLPVDAVRAVAAWLQADAIVLGSVASGGAFTDLVLVDGATGGAVAALRRAGSAWAAGSGVHALAVSSTERALDGLVKVLRTPPGELPGVKLPTLFEPAPGDDVP